ncbi:hypothetical protein P4O66_004995 [Electrophorus voltai]|uniref:DMAP1-binding domain-containing protein n=1 Tax=Electrophorus voltai TaxID=2609070 RepID=A0AAD8ZW94_9TELE|nr:hypothetical protein P4O66_004995 [Electrophorus voltai]
MRGFGGRGEQRRAQNQGPSHSHSHTLARVAGAGGAGGGDITQKGYEKKRAKLIGAYLPQPPGKPPACVYALQPAQGGPNGGETSHAPDAGSSPPAPA